MSVKLVFHDNKGTTLYEKDILYDGLAHLPKPGDGISLPGGEHVEVKSRQFAYVDSENWQIAVQIRFACEKVEKPTTGAKKSTEF